MIEQLLEEHKPALWVSELLKEAMRKTKTSWQRERVMNLYFHIADRYTYNHMYQYHAITDQMTNTEFLEHQAKTFYRFMRMVESKQNRINEESKRIMENSSCTITL